MAKKQKIDRHPDSSDDNQHLRDVRTLLKLVSKTKTAFVKERLDELLDIRCQLETFADGPYSQIVGHMTRLIKMEPNLAPVRSVCKAARLYLRAKEIGLNLGNDDWVF